jgi:hypothetical protein
VRRRDLPAEFLRIIPKTGTVWAVAQQIFSREVEK